MRLDEGTRGQRRQGVRVGSVCDAPEGSPPRQMAHTVTCSQVKRCSLCHGDKSVQTHPGVMRGRDLPSVLPNAPDEPGLHHGHQNPSAWGCRQGCRALCGSSRPALMKPPLTVVPRHGVKGRGHPTPRERISCKTCKGGDGPAEASAAPRTAECMQWAISQKATFFPPLFCNFNASYTKASQRTVSPSVPGETAALRQVHTLAADCSAQVFRE